MRTFPYFLTRPILAVCVAFLALTSLPGCTSTNEPPSSNATARPEQWARPIDASMNLYQIDELLYRSQQPTAENLAQIKALNIQTVVNFRQYHSDKTLLSGTQINELRIPMYTANIDDAEVIAALNAMMQARQQGPVLIHCQHGADRTGLMSAMYRIIYQGWSKEAAIEELTQGGYGFHTMWTNIPQYIQSADIAKLVQQLQFKPEPNVALQP